MTSWLEMLVIFEAGRIIQPLKFTCSSWADSTDLPPEMIDYIHKLYIAESIHEIEGSDWYKELVYDKAIEIYHC
jgi:hypothetical protein